MPQLAHTPDLKGIQYALYTINRHAKTALDSTELYDLKKKTLEKLVNEKLAEKMRLEYSNNPRKGLQSSVVLVKVGTTDSEHTFYFHTLAQTSDFKLKLEHSGKINYELQNPRVHMGLETAKSILYQYIGEKPPRKKINPKYHKKNRSEFKKKNLENVFISSYLDGRKRY